MVQALLLPLYKEGDLQLNNNRDFYPNAKILATSQPFSFLLRPFLDVVDNFTDQVRLIAHNCASVVDIGFHYANTFVTMVMSFFDVVVDRSERAYSDAQVMAHFAVNKNIN